MADFEDLAGGIDSVEGQQPDISPRSGEQAAHDQGARGKLQATNWLADISCARDFPIVQVQFKNTRAGFYLNPQHLDLCIGDKVVVEAAPGTDLGTVSMVGRLVELQMRKSNVKHEAVVKRVFRKAREYDIERFEEARAREHDTMIRSRKIAEDLGLNMKIGDVEYQGDGGKAIFYYIADERVDFRKLIRVLADTFRVRVEMKQIGARQEAGRIGGIGPCGRPLCCASWMSHFVSVGTSAARFQDLSMNPQKLAGQCAKLKCCLNFEVDTYMESQKKLPPKDAVLETKDAVYYPFKTDVLARKITYSTDKKIAANLVTIDARRAFEIIALNKQGVKVDEIASSDDQRNQSRNEFVDLAEQESITRFDNSKKKKKRKGKAAPRQESAERDRRQNKVTPKKENQDKNRDKQARDHRPSDRPNRRNNDRQHRPHKDSQKHNKGEE